MNQSSVSNLTKQVPITGHPQDTIAIFSQAYNQLLSRLSIGINHQKNFVSNASHELKTPLARAITSLDLAILNLNDQQINQAQKQINLVKQDLFGLSSLVEKLLLLSKLESHQNPPQLQTFDLTALIKRLIDQSQDEINQKKIKLNFNHTTAFDSVIDPDHLRLIVGNILSNAIKYSPSASNIDIHLQKDSNYVQIQIIDHGPGISQTDQANIFQRFYRANSVRQSVSGSGLGLSIVKELADQNGYTLTIKSSPNQGTTVTISHIPLKKYHEN